MAIATSRFRVLVVDDNRDAAESLARFITALDQGEVVCTTQSCEALALVAKHRPDLVFLDLGMPDPDGYIVARLIRSNFPEWPIRLVAMTGYGSPSDRARTRLAGFDAHLLKPASPALVEATLAELLSNRR
jgi:CheY-like chemotaxis protein